MKTDTNGYTDPTQAVSALVSLYDAQTQCIRTGLQTLVAGGELAKPVQGYYPLIRIDIDQASTDLPLQSFGYCDTLGSYVSTITRPDLFADYLVGQLAEISSNHSCKFYVELSDQAIPVHFAFPDGVHVEGALDHEKQQAFQTYFDVPDLATMDDELANGEVDFLSLDPKPLSLFSAPRIDYSLHRLRHYTGTACEHFQKHVLFTNYHFYVEGFRTMAQELVDDPNNDYQAFVEPAAGGHGPQMPAYHLQAPDGQGITLVNIGVGPSNAKTITDHIAVLRPSAWIMLGHCAGLRSTQRLGDFVLAHGYVRDDHVLDADLPLWVPIPALAEVQQSLEKAVAEVADLPPENLKQVMRTGTVASIDNRNWELRDQSEPVRRFSQSRAIALDMESATIAANGFRFRVPYGTLLIVSDRPLHGELKLPGMASEFYRTQVASHLKIGVRTMELLRDMPDHRLHSRKLRSFNEVPFR